MAIREEIPNEQTRVGDDIKSNGTDAVDVSEETSEKVDDMSKLPVDRGWAWMILAGAIFQMFIYGGMMKSYGIFFVEYQKHFRSSASETTIILTIQNIVISVSGIFAMSIGMKYMTARTSVCIGGLVNCLAHFASAFAKDIRILNVMIGVLSGTAVSFIFLPIVATIGVYFNKRRGLANSLTTSGASLGALVFGPVYTILFENFGYKGTMIIASGILLHIVVSGVLMRPPEFYTKHKTREHNAKAETLSPGTTVKPDGMVEIKYGDSDRKLAGNTTAADEEPIDDKFEERHILLRDCSNSPRPQHEKNTNATATKQIKMLPRLRHLDFARTVSYDPEYNERVESPSPLLQRARANTSSYVPSRKRTFSELSNGSGFNRVIDSISRSKVALYTSADVLFGSMANVYSNENDTDADMTKTKETDACDDKSNADENKFVNMINNIIVFLKTVFDISLFKDPVFIHFMCMAFICLPGSVMTSVYMIPYSKDIGISNRQAGILMFVIGCVDLVSRICVGFIADKKWLKPTTLLAIAALVMAIMSSITRLVTSYLYLMIYAIIQGSFSGVYIALYAVILVETIGMQRFKSSLGFTAMCHGISNAVFFPLTGLLRDATGAYYWTFHMLSVLLFLGSILAITLPLTHRWSMARNKNTNKTCHVTV